MKKKTEIKAYLTITSWVGFCGLHYYGSLRFNDKREDLMWIPPAKYRKMLNSYEEKRYKLKPKESTSRFLRKDDVVKEAIKQWKEMFPEADILLDGLPGDPDCPIIDRR